MFIRRVDVRSVGRWKWTLCFSLCPHTRHLFHFSDRLLKSHVNLSIYILHKNKSTHEFSSTAAARLKGVAAADTPYAKKSVDRGLRGGEEDNDGVQKTRAHAFYPTLAPRKWYSYANWDPGAVTDGGSRRLRGARLANVTVDFCWMSNNPRWRFNVTMAASLQRGQRSQTLWNNQQTSTAPRGFQLFRETSRDLHCLQDSTLNYRKCLLIGSKRSVCQEFLSYRSSFFFY